MNHAKHVVCLAHGKSTSIHVNNYLVPLSHPSPHSIFITTLKATCHLIFTEKETGSGVSKWLI